MDGSDGVEWEQQVEGYLNEHGYDTQCRARIAGHEIDVFGQRFDERLAIECKDWSSPVGIGPIRDIKSKADDVDARPGIAYTSRLTSDAAEKARRWGFEVIPYERICYDDTGVGRIEFLEPGTARPAASPARIAERIVEELPELTVDPVSTRDSICEVVTAELDDTGVPTLDPSERDGDTDPERSSADLADPTDALSRERAALRRCSLDLDALAESLASRMEDRGHAPAGVQPAVKHGLEGGLPVDDPAVSVQLVDGNEVLLWRPGTDLDPVSARALAESVRQAVEQHVDTDAITFLEAVGEDLTALLAGTRLPVYD